MPFVKFIENDDGDFAQQRIVDDPAGENAFGHETYSGVRAVNGLESYRVTCRSPDLLPHLLGDADGSQARCQSPGFKDEKLAAIIPA